MKRLKRSWRPHYIVCLLLINGFFIHIGHGQDKIMIQSEMDLPKPQVYSPAPLPDIPVDHYTGTMSLKIPLYTIGDDIINDEVAIVYHGRALDMTEIPSWVGAGWQLAGGGSVTREVRGNSDHAQIVANCFDDDGCISEQFWAGWSGQNLPASVDINGVVTYADGEQSHMRDNLFQHFVAPPSYATARTVYDGEPDVFHFNFLGFSGSFMFDNDNEIVFTSPQDLAIETSPSQDLDPWVIRGPDGTRYFFGTDFHNEWTSFGGPTRQVSTWYLTKVVAMSGQRLEFNYQFDDGRTGDYHGDSYLRYTESDIQGYGPFPGATTTNLLSVVSQRNSRLLSTIVYYNADNIPLKQIRFDATADRIDTSNDNESTRKRLNGVYLEYFEQGEPQIRSWYRFNNDNARNRLWLRGLSKLGTDRPFYHEYSFEYYNEQELPPLFRVYPPEESLISPYGFTDQRDFWNFFNGRDNPNTLVPEYDLYGKLVYKDGANRNPDLDRVRYGMLTKVTFPSGASQRFHYSSHHFRDHNGAIRHGAGARISEIVLRDEHSQVVSRKEYDYEREDGSTSGKLLSKVGFKYKTIYPDQKNLVEREVKTIENIYNKSTVAYDRVVVKHFGKSDARNGREVYEFTNNYHTYNPITYNFSTDIGMNNLPVMADPSNGNLLKKAVYAWEGGQDVLKEQITYDYVKTFEKTIHGFRGEYPFKINSIIRSHDQYAANGAVASGQYGKLLRYSYYAVPIAWHQLQQKSSVQYFDNSEYRYSENFTYYDAASPWHGRVEFRTMRSQDEEYKEHFLYTDPTAVNFTKTRFYGVLKEGQYVSARSQTYNEEGLPLTMRVATLSQPFSGTASALLSTMTDEDVVVEQDYGKNGKVREMRSRSGQVNTYLWGDGGSHMLGHIQSVGYNDVRGAMGPREADQLYNADITDGAVFSAFKDLRKQLPEAMISFYTYRDGAGPTFSVDENYLIHEYQYDAQDRLKLQKREGAILERYRYNFSDESALIPLFLPSRSIAEVDQTITFVVLEAAPEWGETLYRWDFGDGNVIETYSDRIDYAYESVGGREVTLTMENPEYESASYSVNVTIILRQLKTNPTSLTFAYNGPSQTVAFEDASGAVSISADRSWITISNVSASSFTVSCDIYDNILGKRQGTITVSDALNTVEIPLTQNDNPELSRCPDPDCEWVESLQTCLDKYTGNLCN